MSKVRVAAFSISLDGYGAGADQSVENPLGRGGEELHNWFVPTRAFQSIHGREGGTTGVDDDVASKAFVNLGAWIMGRNMFGPVRGPWPDGEWKGWWGDNPPYHGAVFVLTHYAREPVEMEGGTTFHFVTGGIEEALERARAAVGHRDILIGGGVATVRQYLEAQLIDEMHLAMSPILLGSGESLFEGLDLPKLGYRVTATKASDLATHVFIERGA
jgi:dihydrofolate reductase